MENIDVLYDLCDVISEEMEEANEKIRSAGGKLTAGDVDYIDKLTHALKSIKTTIAMEEADEHSYDDGRMMPRDRGSYARSGERGRGRNARRDSVGRYSRESGYSRAEGVKHMLKDAMEEAETDREREAIRKALKEMER